MPDEVRDSEKRLDLQPWQEGSQSLGALRNGGGSLLEPVGSDRSPSGFLPMKSETLGGREVDVPCQGK